MFLLDQFWWKVEQWGEKGGEAGRREDRLTRMSTSASVSNIAKITSSNICQGQGFSSTPALTKSLPVSVRLDKVGKLQRATCVSGAVHGILRGHEAWMHKLSWAEGPRSRMIQSLHLYKKIWKHQSIGTCSTLCPSLNVHVSDCCPRPPPPQERQWPSSIYGTQCWP